MAVVQRISGGIRGRIKDLLAGERRVSSADGPPLVSINAGGLTAECHRAWPADPAFHDAWERLTQRSQMSTTFTSPLWQRAVSDADPTGQLRLIAVRRGTELAAVLPMRLSDEGFLDAAGFAVSDYLDPLVEDDADQEVWRAILALLREVWDGHVKAMTLHNLRQESPCRRWLLALAEAEGFRAEEKPVGCRMTIALPATWQGYLAMLDRHQRKELRRKMNKAQEAGAIIQVLDSSETNNSVRSAPRSTGILPVPHSLEGCATRNAMPHSPLSAAHLERALDLMEAAQGMKRQWLREHVRPLMMKIGVDLAARGRMRFLMLMLNDAPAACLLELPSPRGPLMYNCGMDPAMKPWSPGAAAFALAIADAIERNCEIFDLLRGADEYKARLGAVREEMWRVSVFR